MRAHKEILINLARNMQSFGYTEEEIFRLAEFNLDEVVDEQDMVDAEYGIRFWKAIIKASNYPLLGLSFGKNISFSALSWIAGLTQSASNLKEAWDSFCSFSLLMGDMFYYELKEEKELVKINYYPNKEWLLISEETAWQACDHAMSLTMSLTAFLSGRTIPLAQASFSRVINKKYQADYERVFGKYKDAAEFNQLVFYKSDSELPVITSNKVIYEHMLSFCEERLKEIVGVEKYSDKVKAILMNKNSFYLPKLEEVAAMLHLSARTLQRKLKEENILYHSLVEEHQIAQAKNLLKQKQLQLKEVAYLLGYSNTESFHRSFKRNTGLSPGAFKRQ